MKKKWTSSVMLTLLAALMVFVMTACGSKTLSITVDVENGDQIVVTMDLQDGHTMALNNGTLHVMKDKAEIGSGSFTTEEILSARIEECGAQMSAAGREGNWRIYSWDSDEAFYSAFCWAEGSYSGLYVEGSDYDALAEAVSHITLETKSSGAEAGHMYDFNSAIEAEAQTEPDTEPATEPATVAETEPATEPDTEPETKSAPVQTGDEYVLGSDENGYVYLPGEFVKFVEEGGLGGVYADQASLRDQSVIVTLMTMDSEMTAEEAASAVMASLQEDANVDPESIMGAQVTIGGYDAYQVYCYYTNLDKFLVTWLFEAPDHDEYLHYLAFEFTSDKVDYFDYSETFTFTAKTVAETEELKTAGGSGASAGFTTTDWRDFEVRVEDAVIRLPISCKDFESATGFAFTSDDERSSTLEGGYYTTVWLENADGVRINVDLTNGSDGNVAYEDCMVTGIYSYLIMGYESSLKYADIELANGVGRDTTYDDVKTLMDCEPEWDSKAEGKDYMSLDYYAGEYIWDGYLSIDFNEDGTINTISLDCPSE